MLIFYCVYLKAFACVRVMLGVACCCDLGSSFYFLQSCVVVIERVGVNVKDDFSFLFCDSHVVFHEQPTCTLNTYQVSPPWKKVSVFNLYAVYQLFNCFGCWHIDGWLEFDPYWWNKVFCSISMSTISFKREVWKFSDWGSNLRHHRPNVREVKVIL